MSDERVTNIVVKVLKRLDEELYLNVDFSAGAETCLFGEGGILDSLGLVSLIVALEEEIEDEFDVSLALAGEEGMFGEDNPFNTIQSVSEYISLLLRDARNG